MTIAAGLYLVAFITWILMFVFSARAFDRRREGSWASWTENPFNFVFRPEDLTEPGLAERKKCHWCFLISVASFLIGTSIMFSVG